MSIPSIDDLTSQSGKRISTKNSKRKNVKRFLFFLGGVLSVLIMFFLFSKIWDSGNKAESNNNDIDGIKILTPISDNLQIMLQQKITRFNKLLDDTNKKNVTIEKQDLILANCFGVNYSTEVIRLNSDIEKKSTIENLTLFVDDNKRFKDFYLIEVDWKLDIQGIDTMIYLSNLGYFESKK